MTTVSVHFGSDTTLVTSPLNEDVLDIRSSKEDVLQTKLQECWDKSIAKHMDLLDGYQNACAHYQVGNQDRSAHG